MALSAAGVVRFLTAAIVLTCAPVPSVAADDALAACLVKRQRACLVDAAVAEALARTDPSDQINGLGAVARLVAMAGDRGSALNILYRGEDIIALIADPDVRDDARVFLVQGFADIEAFSIALLDADRIEDEARRVFARSMVAIAAADAGNIVMVERLLPEANEQLGDELRETLLELLAEDRQWDRVVAIASDLVFWNPDIARTVPGQLVAIGRFEDAVHLYERITTPGLRDFAARGFVDGLLARRDFATARQMALGIAIRNPYQSDSALVDLVEALARDGQVSEAEALIAQIGDGETRGDGMVTLARVLAERGEFAAAMAIGIKAETDPPPARNALTTQRLPRLIYDTIARAQVEHGDFAGAVATAKRMNDVRDRSVTLEAIARRRLDVGDQANVLLALNEILNDPRVLEPTVVRDIVRDLVRMYELPRALEVVERLPQPGDRAQTLARAAPQVVDDPETYRAILQAAGVATMAISAEQQRRGMITQLAVLWARGRQFDVAANLLATVNDAERSRALLAIAFPLQQPVP